jgi:hypothetical protein
MKTLLADADFLIALYDEQKASPQAKAIYRDYLSQTRTKLLIPWPILYETISTRMTRRQHLMERLRDDWGRLKQDNRLELLDDTLYRQTAFDECFLEAAKPTGNYRALSLADRVVRGMLAHRNLRIDVFVTLNSGDFKDVCAKSRRLMLP